MRAKIVGIFPVPGTGLTWVSGSGSVEFEFDPIWSDDIGRAASPVRGILHPTTRDRFVAPSSLGDIFVPATPTGTGVIAGPAVTMRYTMTDSAGNTHNNTVYFRDGLLANASNEWNVNQRALPAQLATSPGPDPVGLTIAAGDARYALLTLLATTGAHGLARLATDAEAFAGSSARVVSGQNLFNLIFGAAFTGGFGANETGGTLDWNHASNARPGSGNTLLLGSASNGPGGGTYYHPFCFEYATKNGGGNLTQIAIPYTVDAVGEGVFIRSRFTGTWTAWKKILLT